MSGLPLVIDTLPLGAQAELRIALDSFNGQPRLDVRTWCIMGDAGEFGPTRRGASLSLRSVPQVLTALDRALAKAADLGLAAERSAKAA